MTEAKDGYGYIMPHFDTVTGLPFANEQLYFPHELSAWAPRMTHKGGYEELRASLAPHARSLRVLAMTTQGMVALTSDRSTPRRAADIGPAVEEAESVLFGGVDSSGVARFIAILDSEEDWDALVEGIHAPAATSAAPADPQWLSLRHEAAFLEAADCSSCARALALLRWHERTRYCPRCGGKLQHENGGEAQRCIQCDRLEYPRQDPAVIVAITDAEDRLLLAHNRSWKPRFMSLIAGFVEAGEAPEHAVVREAKEEASLDVEEVRYVATQPWPFPRSVMIGFTGKVSGTPDPSPDMEEVDAMKWMTRAELIDAVNSGELEIPTHTAIARMMIDTWLHAEDDAL